ncbi:glutathione ABC transporter substrate-binding protein [Halalkalibacillus sediminis]|uniref:Glutathione ABC transporter substrate-binding protein n=1 Tax=Halalkalibacillus sediminis TaxID=2018042 RepID=A0A2I0QS88_9BACI|nr:glutathione ABC transporter substrate-binding protein [Halalkalibacillus sediminis]PKR77178.1 glutathione ABC transporter substrate-binding protein [Halalkalibacillus sediminis]
MKKLIFMLVLLLGLLLAACSGDSGDSEESSDEGSTDTSSESSEEASSDEDTAVTYASTSDAVGLSPILTNDSVSSRVIEQMYETLFTRNLESGDIEPRLAESYETPDDKTWVISLKEDIQFHDGTPFNAEAVKYTFDTFLDPETAAPRASLLEPIESVEVQDEYTVVINTTEPYGAMLAALSHSNASIVSPEANEGQNLNEEPVGTGPYKFVEWAKGDQIVLEKNEDYWQGEPEIDQATFKVVPSVSTAISMMETGEVDFIDGVTAEHLTRLESNDSIEVVTKEGTPVYYFGFNHEKEPMNEFDFRKALSHAIDRDAYVETLDGLGVRSNSIIGPKVFGYDESAEELGFNYDPEQAQQIIEENGYDEIELNLLVANRDLFLNMSEIVQAQLSEVGLNVNIEMIEWGTFLDMTAEGDFDLTFLSWSNTTADGSELLYPNLHTDNIGSSNRMQYSNEEVDELVEASRTTTDQNERAEYLQQANEIVVEDVAWAPMHHGVVAAGVHESIEGFEMDPTGRWELYQFSKN